MLIITRKVREGTRLVPIPSALDGKHIGHLMVFV